MKLKKNKILLFLILFGICLCSLVSISAKYINQSTTDGNLVKAKAFYFESDLLDGDIHRVTALNDDGTASVTFHLMNYADKERISEVDINYKVSITSSDNATNLIINNPNGTLSKNNESDTEVTIGNLKQGVIYTITATTNNTYEKTLSATIDVRNVETGLSATVEDKTDYIEVTVYTKDESKNEISLKYCTGLIPDNTDILMENAKISSAEEISFGLNANSSHVFRFFKKNTSNKYEVKVNGNEVSINEQSNS